MFCCQAFTNARGRKKVYLSSPWHFSVSPTYLVPNEFGKILTLPIYDLLCDNYFRKFGLQFILKNCSKLQESKK